MFHYINLHSNKRINHVASRHQPKSISLCRLDTTNKCIVNWCLLCLHRQFTKKTHSFADEKSQNLFPPWIPFLCSTWQDLNVFNNLQDTLCFSNWLEYYLEHCKTIQWCVVVATNPTNASIDHTLKVWGSNGVCFITLSWFCETKSTLNAISQITMETFWCFRVWQQFEERNCFTVTAAFESK